MHRAATAEVPGDFVIATGVAHSVEDFVRSAFARAGIFDWQAHVERAPEFDREADPSLQVGNAAKAARELGWKPTRSFEEIVATMVDADLERAN
jgi:GDPmannose 4,6-dehydratase